MSNIIAKNILLVVMLALISTESISETIDLKINVQSRPFDAESSLSISLGFTTQTLAQPIEDGTYRIPLSVPRDGDRYIQPVITARWGNGIIQAVELSPSVYFIEQPVTVSFFGLEDTGFNCRDARISDPPSAFEVMFHCRAVALKIENQGRRWTKEHREALEAWHRANRYMTDTLADTKRRSPYTLDPVLIQRFQSLVDHIEDRRWNNRDRNRQIKPLRYERILQTLRMHEERRIQFAEVIPELVDAKRLEDAIFVTNSVQESLVELMQQRGINKSPNYTVQGINLQLLENNAVYIGNLMAHQETIARTDNPF